MDRRRAARLLFQLPRECRVFTSINPSAQWGWSEVFANKTNHLLELLLWQNAYDPKKKSQHKANRPKPFIPEFMKPEQPPSEISKEAETMTVDDVKSWLATPRGV